VLNCQHRQYNCIIDVTERRTVTANRPIVMITELISGRSTKVTTSRDKFHCPLFTKVNKQKQHKYSVYLEQMNGTVVECDMSAAGRRLGPPRAPRTSHDDDDDDDAH